MVLSPSLIQMLPACLNVCLSSSGSRIGSNSSPIFSNKIYRSKAYKNCAIQADKQIDRWTDRWTDRHTGVPNWMQFSSVRTKSESVSLMTCRLLAFSIFFTHLLAWPWGSIIRGHRRALLHITQCHDSQWKCTGYMFTWWWCHFQQRRCQLVDRVCSIHEFSPAHLE